MRRHFIAMFSPSSKKIATLGLLFGTFVAQYAGAQAYKVLYSFQCQADGANPVGRLIRDGDGNLYGITGSNAGLGFGTVFKLDSAGTLTTLHTFAGPPTDGSFPRLQGLVRDGAGNLYGTTEEGGTVGQGTVFKLAADGTETVLHNFFDEGSTDGVQPIGGLVLDSSGPLYGETFSGGTFGAGTGFRLTTTGK